MQNHYLWFGKNGYEMNKRQKMQVVLGVLFAVLMISWLFLPGELYLKLLGIVGNGLGLLSMILSYRAEEKNKR